MINVLAIKEMQVKTTQRFHPVQAKWLSSSKQTTASAGEEGGKRNPQTLLVRM
jgi:hypothetical protein